MVDIFAKVVEILQRFLNYMTPGKFIMAVMCGIVTLLGTMVWENRQPMATSVTSMLASKPGSTDFIISGISDESKATIQKYISGDPNIVAFQVVGTDFVKLTKNSVYFTAKSKELQLSFESFQEGKLANSPIMTMNDDENNLRIIAIMNQQFVCVPLTPAILRNIPQAPKYAKQICSLSVPPRYGDMVGFLVVWMREEIAAEDAEYYRNLARFLANEIYRRDISPRS